MQLTRSYRHLMAKNCFKLRTKSMFTDKRYYSDVPNQPDESGPSFDRRRTSSAFTGKKTSRQFILKSPSPSSNPQFFLPPGLVNPLLGPTDGIFPDLRGSFVRFTDNQIDLKKFPYELEQSQLDEASALVKGLSYGKSVNGIPRIVTVGYADAMGDVMLEQVVLGLANQLEADILTFHARDFAGMLDGCAKLWYGRSYFRASFNQKNIEDDLVLTENRESNERWLSQLMRKQATAKTNNKSSSSSSSILPIPADEAVDMRIKETVSLYSVLKFLHSCMEQSDSKLKMIHLTGFGSSLLNSSHRSQIQKFIFEQMGENSATILVITEPPATPTNNINSNAEETESSVMPVGLSSFLLTKGKCEKVSEIPNTPEFDANWLVDRNSFGGLKIYFVPPKDQSNKQSLMKRLETDHRQRVLSFNVKRITDVISQLGLEADADLLQIASDGLTKSPLLLSETIYIAYMASEKNKITKDSLDAAIKLYLANRELHRNHFIPPNSTTKNHQGAKLDVKSLTKYEKRFLSCIVTSNDVKTRFDDIGALDKVKRTLYELITLPLDRPELFKEGILREAVSGILLFGPPGTGKTMLAKAVAAQSKSNFIAVNSSNIYDMYVGEGEKNVKALFKLARKLSPCIIFIDEVDAILDTRSNAIGKASRVEILNEFMAEWDGLLSQSSESRIMVMAATNRPFALDDAVLRRLPRRILVDLPDPSARLSILNLLLKSDALCPNLDLQVLAGEQMTRNYSGSDLKNLAIAAAMNSLRRSLDDQKDRQLTFADFEKALTEVPASISDSMETLVELRKWDQNFGEGKRLSKSSSFGFI